MSLDEPDAAVVGAARKAAGDPEDAQGATKRARVAEETKERKTPNYPFGFGDCKDKTLIYEPSSICFVEVERCVIPLTAMQMWSETPPPRSEYKTDQGTPVTVEFDHYGGNRVIAMIPTNDEVGSQQFYDAEMRLLKVLDFAKCAKMNRTGDMQLTCYVAVKNHHFDGMDEVTSRWSLSCLFDELPRYTKSVRVMCNNKPLAVLRAYQVEFHAPAMARLMRSQMDREPTAEAVTFDLACDDLDAARQFLEITVSGLYHDWCDELSIPRIQEVLRLAQTWFVSDHPSARSTHTPLFEALLNALHNRAEEQTEDIEYRLDLFKTLVVACKNGASPRLLARVSRLSSLR
jgi:hypothetical protein